jgi:hypothetical protein
MGSLEFTTPMLANGTLAPPRGQFQVLLVLILFDWIMYIIYATFYTWILLLQFPHSTSSGIQSTPFFSRVQVNLNVTQKGPAPQVNTDRSTYYAVESPPLYIF